VAAEENAKAINQAEDGGADTNPQREREGNREDEAGILLQLRLRRSSISMASETS